MSEPVRVKIPKKLTYVFSGTARYRGAYGGRGSGKSFTFAKMTAIRGMAKPIRILCAREFQNSIKESVHHEIIKAIESEPWLNDFYEWGESYIRGKNGTEYVFKGLRNNYKEIKSTADIDICWVEEAEAVSEKSWQVLIPTIRNAGSEIWLTWNPESEDSATHQRFIVSPPENSRIVKLNYADNPWFPAELEEERQNDLKRDLGLYMHIWEGEVKSNTDAQVFKNVEVREIAPPPGTEFLFGADWGYAQDPNAINRLWIDGKTIFIDYEAHGIQTEIDDLPELWDTVPAVRDHTVRADSARPELISFMKSKGFKVEAVKKGAGSVEAGISFLLNYDIVVHPRCRRTIEEFSKFCYKVHRLTGDILPDTIDAWNHHLDGIRYACEPLIRQNVRKSIWE